MWAIAASICLTSFTGKRVCNTHNFLHCKRVDSLICCRCMRGLKLSSMKGIFLQLMLIFRTPVKVVLVLVHIHNAAMLYHLKNNTFVLTISSCIKQNHYLQKWILVPPSRFMSNCLLVWSQFQKSLCINRSQWHSQLCS